MSQLTEEQKILIEEKKQIALQKLLTNKQLKKDSNPKLLNQSSILQYSPIFPKVQQNYFHADQNINVEEYKRSGEQNFSQLKSFQTPSRNSFSPNLKNKTFIPVTSQTINVVSSIFNKNSIETQGLSLSTPNNISSFKGSKINGRKDTVARNISLKEFSNQSVIKSCEINRLQNTQSHTQKLIVSEGFDDNIIYPAKSDKISVELSFVVKSPIWFRCQCSDKKHNNGIIRQIAKNISSCTYEPSSGSWLFHIKDHQTVKSLFEKSLNVTLNDIPSNVVKLLQKAHNNSKINKNTDICKIDSDLLEKLLPFQREGVVFGIEHNGRLLIADDMGLGKTVQAIAICLYYRDKWPVLIICPSSVKMSWKQDESHFLKSHNASRTKNILPLLQASKHVILLSGTPALSRPKELFTQISALDQKLFGSFHSFRLRYCDAKETKYGWDDNGCSNSEELSAVLSSTIMIRRMKSEVLNQLPEKQRQIIILDPSFVECSKKLQSSCQYFVTSQKKDKRTALLAYYEDTSSAKLNGVCEFISDKLLIGQKIIVFAHHIKMLDGIEEVVRKKNICSIRIDGSTNSKQRQVLVDDFTNNKECLIAILSLTAAGTGLNISVSSCVIFAELYWNPGQLIQAEDRAYRIGQKNAVSVIYLVAKNTADDYIWPIVQEKLHILTNLGVGSRAGLHGQTSSFKDSRQRQIEDFFNEMLQDCDDIFLENDCISSKDGEESCSKRMKMS
ncbi:SWI/SNF-related matrix-associated actin-dependent regulator of chromatin subfamily A-like protein 1 isoform X4 [Hydra vulgaris]|uniref:SWI/SNF-related matrix-associated actin-dependent regulator of chromatin subfamily A-like protein 1 isoform X4 n=1 Tax=Hydra vulgaris TaxID=6087 RepID=A0ABM4CWC3_HYDVU